MSLPTEINYEVYAGDTFEEVIEYLGTEDLTGATARVQLRASLVATTTILEVVPSIDEVAKTVTLELSSTETASLITTTSSKATSVYDVELTFSNGKVKTIQKGSLVTYLDITR